MDFVYLKPTEVGIVSFFFGEDINLNDRISTYTLKCYDTKTGADISATAVEAVYAFLGDPTLVIVHALISAANDGDLYKIDLTITTLLGKVFSYRQYVSVMSAINTVLEKTPDEIQNIEIDFQQWIPHSFDEAWVKLNPIADGTYIADGSIIAAPIGYWGDWPPIVLATRIVDGADVTSAIIKNWKIDGYFVTVTLRAGDAGQMYRIGVSYTNMVMNYQYDILMVVN